MKQMKTAILLVAGLILLPAVTQHTQYITPEFKTGVYHTSYSQWGYNQKRLMKHFQFSKSSPEGTLSEQFFISIAKT
jgi:hypothetical protein